MQRMPPDRGSLQNSGGIRIMTELEKQWAELQAKIEWLMNYVRVLQEENDQLVTKCHRLIQKYEETKCPN
jgi:predicted nuclease with TOPRIM domain